MFANRYINGCKIPAVVFLIIAVILIFAYGAYRRKTGTSDPLERKVIAHESCPGADGWGFLHFFFFLFLGVFYPGHYMQSLAISIGWELFEGGLGSHNIKMSGVRLQLMGATDASGTPIQCDDDEENWWYGRSTDVCFNLMGYIVGSALGKKYWPPSEGPEAVSDRASAFAPAFAPASAFARPLASF